MILVLLFPLTALAEPTLQSLVPRPLLGHPVFDLRFGAGVATGTSGGPLIVCAQARPMARLAVEACGNGAGWLHDGDVPDFAHFRLRGVVATRSWGTVEGEVVALAGLAELQSGADSPGFQLGTPTVGDPVEAAGPEAALAVQARAWVHERAYVTADLTAGAAHIPGAPAVAGTAGPVVAFGALTVGAGF